MGWSGSKFNVALLLEFGVISVNLSIEEKDAEIKCEVKCLSLLSSLLFSLIFRRMCYINGEFDSLSIFL
jgi:hypothetical protein